MKNPTSLTFTFENPNPPEVFEQCFREILLEKLLTQFVYAEIPPAAR